MSKLADLLRRVTRSQPAPLGFRLAATKAAPTMLLVAQVGDHWARGAGEAVAAGADVLLLTGRPNERELSEAISAAGERPAGLLTPQPRTDELAQLRQAGLDFVVLEPLAPAAALLDQELTVLLRLQEELSDIQLRAVDALAVEAVLPEHDAAPLTVHRQLELQRLSALTRKPLLVPVAPGAEQDDLLCLRDAGVRLVAVDLKERGAPDALRRLHDVIAALPPRHPRREERLEASLPRMAPAEHIEEEEDEE